MKTQIAEILTGLAALIAAALTAQAQYIYTALNDPLAGHGSGPDTLTDNFCGTNIVGGYGYYGTAGVIHGFVLSGTNWTTLNDPLAGSGPYEGTFASAMSGSNIVGWYVDTNSVEHGFIHTGTNWTTLDDPQAAGITDAQGIDGTNISGWCADASGVHHGFLYNTVAQTWITLDAPLAGSGSGQGTVAERISDSNIVGCYIDGDGVNHGFLYDISASTWTTLDAPGASGGGTLAFNISGTNIVGVYWGANGIYHGFLLNGTHWTTLDDPLGASGSGQGSYALGIEGTTIVGIYFDSVGNYHGYLATPLPQLETTLSGSAVTVSWPYWNNALTGWTLQQNSDLTTTNWTPAPTGGISNDGTNNYYMITPSPGNLFFRLRRQ
jgi:hypothetical protein